MQFQYTAIEATQYIFNMISVQTHVTQGAVNSIGYYKDLSRALQVHGGSWKSLLFILWQFVRYTVINALGVLIIHLLHGAESFLRS